MNPTSYFSTPDDKRATRSDGQEARERLFLAALRLFAEQGYAKTSTREIASAAEVNISAISYYFGDKQGLYRAVFCDQRYVPNLPHNFFDDQALSLRDGVATLVRLYTDCFKQGEIAQNFLRMHIREMVDPTGLWQEEIENNIQPLHQSFVRFLGRQLKLPRVDDDVHRLAFGISGLALSLMANSDVIAVVRPKLMQSSASIDVFAERLIDYAVAMCEAERQRRFG